LDERATRRVVVDVEVEARFDDHPCRVFVTDLSAGGCMIEMRSGDIIPGDRLVLHFERLLDVAGRMVWMRGGIGGVQFNEHLHDAVVDRLGFFRRSDDSDDPAQLYDSFGRALPVPRPVRPQTIQL